MQRTFALATLSLLLATGGAGCLDALGERLGFGPNYDAVFLTELDTEGWNRDGRVELRVEHSEPVDVELRARSVEGGAAELSSDGLNEASLLLPDGIWRIDLVLDGRTYRTIEPVRVDATAPEPEGLERRLEAPQGRALVSATLPEDVVAMELIDADTGQVLATNLPYTLRGLDDGLHVYQVVTTDRAGNTYHATVQVWAGEALELPDGRFTAGIVARYTNEVLLWPLEEPDRYLDRASARAAAPGFLGDGVGITPDAPDVQAVVAEVVAPGMNTLEAALALYQWMADELEYEESRLDEEGLLDPEETLRLGGGVCRDLAGLYVSLLRAAGVPARPVTGYLAGNVQGFHAWVEFYGGRVDGMAPWVPVDVSGIGLSSDPTDDAYTPFKAINAFGILPADYLPLREVPGAAGEGWATAASARFTFIQGNEPRVELNEEVTDRIGGTSTDVVGKLCVHDETLARFFVQTGEPCGEGATHLFDDFLRRTQRTLDYGVQVARASEGTTVTVELAYPFPAAAAPNTVVHQFYGTDGPASGGLRLDAATGKATIELRY
ncbi:MAG: transglutaminase-like domain-containing protein [Thermoplasmatota archaeon]